MPYLLDTNIVSHMVRTPQGQVMQKIREIGEAEVCTSIVVAAELRFGAEKKGSPRLTSQLEAVLRGLPIMPIEGPADRCYGRLRAHLERTGQVIGGNDMLIAAHALALGCIMVTDNMNEFQRVPDLRCENWLR